MKVHFAYQLTRKPQTDKNDWVNVIQVGDIRTTNWGHTDANGQRIKNGCKSIRVNDTVVDFAQRRFNTGYRLAAFAIILVEEIPVVPVDVVEYRVNSISNPANPHYVFGDLGDAQFTAKAWSNFLGCDYVVEHVRNGEVEYANLYESGNKRC